MRVGCRVMPNIPLPDLDGGSGGPMNQPDGGGVPGTSTGSSVSIAFPANENGGVFASTYFLFTPVQDIASGQCYIGFYDFSNLDDQKDGSFYSYKQEDVVPDATPTVRRVDLTYQDLGLATITVTVTGTNDNGQVVSASVKQQLGNAVPTNALLTAFVSINLTCKRPQLGLSRTAGSGPVRITRAIMRGDSEEDSE